MRLWRAARGNGLAYGVLATALMILVVGALYDVYAAYHYRTWGYQAAGEAARTGTLRGTGLDYAAVGPEHAYYHDTGRIEYSYAVDEEAMEAFDLLSRLEGIIPALESAHAVAYCLKLAPTLDKDKVIICNLSGRGDKDVMQVAKIKGVEL